MAYEPDFPRNPALVERAYPAPTLSLREIDAPISKQLGSLRVKVTPEPLAVQVSNRAGRLIQQLTFETDGTLSFLFDDHPVLGRGEGGPEPRGQGLADGSFTLYEDDGETLDYLTGECVVTQFDWHDQRAKLVIQRHLPEDANEQASTRLRVELIPDNIVKNVEVVDHLEVPMHE